MAETRASFASTRWSLVLAAGEGRHSESRRALGELCELYWPPIYSYLRRAGHDPESAMDATQGFIASVLERGRIGSPDPDRGRFRSYLLGALKHYLANEQARSRALKRGGGHPTPLSIDAVTAESGFAREPQDHRTPEAAYLRQWALTVLNETLATLRSRYEKEGKGPLFERLHPLIAGDKGGARYRAIGEDLGMTEDAVKMAASRLKRRYRDELRARVAETVAGPEEVDEELRGLIEALRS